MSVRMGLNSDQGDMIGDIVLTETSRPGDLRVGLSATVDTLAAQEYLDTLLKSGRLLRNLEWKGQQFDFLVTRAEHVDDKTVYTLSSAGPPK